MDRSVSEGGCKIPLSPSTTLRVGTGVGILQCGDAGDTLIGGTEHDTVQGDGLTKFCLDNGQAPNRINSGLYSRSTFSSRSGESVLSAFWPWRVGGYAMRSGLSRCSKSCFGILDIYGLIVRCGVRPAHTLSRADRRHSEFGWFRASQEGMKPLLDGASFSSGLGGRHAPNRRAEG